MTVSANLSGIGIAMGTFISVNIHIYMLVHGSCPLNVGGLNGPIRSQVIVSNCLWGSVMWM